MRVLGEHMSCERRSTFFLQREAAQADLMARLLLSRPL
jgi:hypothetical protein